MQKKIDDNLSLAPAPKSDFIGLDTVVHLAAGGETPMLKTQQDVIQRFLADKALGEEARTRMDGALERTREKSAALLGVKPKDIAFLSSSSEGINLLAHGLNWETGDNVVVCDVEFPSDVLPWVRLKSMGVEIRVVRNRNWYISLDDIEAAMDERTKVVAVSDASYFTGQRLDVEALSKMVRSKGAVLSLDVTHSAGVVQVHAEHADVLVSSCYKWLLGTHGAAIFYVNEDRVPNLSPPFVGWHTPVSIPDWREPTVYTPRAGAARFESANHGFISIYILENALDYLLKVGIGEIEKYVRRLGTVVWDGLNDMGLQMMTPREENERAGNVCFMTEHIEAVTKGLAQRNVLVWGGYAGVGRIRISTHLYNTEEDVMEFLKAMEELLPDLA